jgi:hypothetical protein
MWSNGQANACRNEQQPHFLFRMDGTKWIISLLTLIDQSFPNNQYTNTQMTRDPERGRYLTKNGQF